MRNLFVLLALCFVFPLMAKPASGIYHSPDLDEFRIELDDLKYALKAVQVDINLLDERCKKVTSQNKEPNPASLQIVLLEKRIAQLEKTLDKAANDLRSLSTASAQALSSIQELEKNLISHEKRLDEVGKLKGTLTSISKAISQKAPEPSAKTYRVKAGDSLEKIARHNQTTVETLKKINQLSSDKIVVGQELKLSNE
jgi:LysM repeat protein